MNDNMNGANGRQRVINLFAGPGTGKSTGAAYIFAKLKMLGINCELVQEYAKERVWQNDLEVFQNQLYVIAKQSMRMSRLKNKVDVIITDSPIIMGAVYCKNTPYYHDFYKVLQTIDRGYESYNYFLNRVKPYNPAGRFQDEEGAKKIDKEIFDLLHENHMVDTRFDFSGSQDGYDAIIQHFLEATNLNGGKPWPQQ